MCVCKLSWGHSNFSLRNFSSCPHSEKKGSSFPHFFRYEELWHFPRYPHPVPLSPGPSPGISGVSDGFLQLVSVWLVPGAASTRPWSSHLWRKERPNSGGHTAGSGKEGPVELSTGVGLSAAGASGRMGGTWPHSPGVGLAAGAGGGGVLEVPHLTGHTDPTCLPNFTWQERGKARQDEWAKGASCSRELPLHPLGGPSLSTHPIL